MNHSVHWWPSGCLTLKLFGSWNTVTASSVFGAGAVVALSEVSLSGVALSREGGCGMVATSAIEVYVLGEGEDGINGSDDDVRIVKVDLCRIRQIGVVSREWWVSSCFRDTR